MVRVDVRLLCNWKKKRQGMAQIYNAQSLFCLFAEKDSMPKGEQYMTTLKARVLPIATVSLLLVASGAFAQGRMQWKGSGGWGPGSQHVRIYDPKTVETVSGEVVSVEKIPAPKGRGYGVHLTLKTDKETIPIHLGPGWYIEHQDTKIEPKDKIEVTGSRILQEDKPVIIAAGVKKGDETLQLRDEEGFPYWAGWRKH
jgi:hypothetical protein